MILHEEVMVDVVMEGKSIEEAEDDDEENESRDGSELDATCREFVKVEISGADIAGIVDKDAEYGCGCKFEDDGSEEEEGEGQVTGVGVGPNGVG